MVKRIVILALVLSLAGVALARRKPVQLPKDPRQVPIQAQLTSTKTRADLNGDKQREQLLLVNALTGTGDPLTGAEVMLAIIGPDEGGQPGPLIWVRHVSKETQAPAHNGDLTAVDLDGDGASEIILTWDRSVTATAVDRWGEIYAVDELSRPRRVWEGPWEIDTRRDPATPAAERQWFQREIDYSATRKQAGRALMLRSKQSVIAGKVLEKPKVVVERIDVRLRSMGSSR